MAIQNHPTQTESLFFVTTNIKNRRKIFSNPAYAKEAIDTLYRVQNLHPFFLYGFVIMPDHCHLLLFVPEPIKIATIMMQFKSGVSFNLGLGPIWQSRFDSIIPKDSWKVLKYIHMNPVKAGLVERQEEYPWSSACGRWDVSEMDW